MSGLHSKKWPLARAGAAAWLKGVRPACRSPCGPCRGAAECASSAAHRPARSWWDRLHSPVRIEGARCMPPSPAVCPGVPPSPSSGGGLRAASAPCRWRLPAHGVGLETAELRPGCGGSGWARASESWFEKRRAARLASEVATSGEMLHQSLEPPPRAPRLVAPGMPASGDIRLQKPGNGCGARRLEVRRVGLRLLGPNLEALEDRRPKGARDRGIGRVPAARDQDATDARRVVARIECVPGAAQVGFEPAGEIHGIR